MASDLPSAGLRAATFVLTVTALLAVESGADPGHLFPWTSVAGTAVLLVLAGLSARFLPPPDGRTHPPRWAVAGLIGLAAFPFLIDPVIDEVAGQGRPFEIQMLAGFGSVAIGLAALGRYFACLRLATVSSLFLILFGLSLGTKPLLLGCLALYAAAGICWLVIAYRNTLHWAQRLDAVEAIGDTASSVWRVPWGLAGFASVSFLLAAALLAVGPTTMVAPLWELMPTSGGTGDYDRRARGGVNDGDEETSGKNAAATGMVDTDQLLESPLPSLYDAISDLHGPPHKVRDETERAQALSATAKQQHGRTADSQRPSRTFPTSRQSPQNPSTPLSRAARGLFEIEGPTPLHIRAAIFLQFDGRVWVEANPAMPCCPMPEEKSAWMQYPHAPAPEVFADEPVRHRMKVAKLGAGDVAGSGGANAALDGTLIPSAPHLNRFKLGKVDQESFFACGSDGILRMAPRKLPGGVVLDTEAGIADPRKLAQLVIWPWAGDGFAPPQTPHAARLAALAREWVGTRPRGWEQVSVVIERLRAECALDNSTSVPPDYPDAVAYFLFESRRGPDYLFATTAAILLRHLGYRTRLVAGFYAAPEMYDPATRHTPVGKENVHVWPEVLAGGDTWIVLEPTPGYEVMTPPQPLHERAWAAIVGAGSWIAAHPISAGLCIIAIVALLGWRRSWLDALAVARWRLSGTGDWRACVNGAVRLIERRARWVGRGRPANETPGRYFAHGVGPGCTPDREALMRLAEISGWAAYAPEGLSPTDTTDVWSLCNRAVRVWTYRRFARMRSTG